MRRFLLAALLVALCSIVPLVANAQDSNGVVAKGFQADSPGEMPTGALVSIAADDSRRIELADAQSAQRLAGIIDKNPLLTLSVSDEEVQVVLSGTTSALVSDINGQIRAGDKITPSPIAGVGMLAATDGQVVGTAEADFDTANSQTRSITDNNGRAHTVHLGYVPVHVGIAFYEAPGSTFLPPFIQSAADGIAGRPVSLVRILICGVLLIISFISVTALIYSATRSAITSVGRNPLAAGAIRKSLYQAGGIVVAIALSSLLATYLILSL
jgi:hypothetical protein